MGTSTQEGLLLKAIIFITIITMRTLSVTLLLCVVIVLTEANKCPDGWTFHDLRCFRYVKTKATWINAEKACQALGANLASIKSSEEHIFVQGVVRKFGGGSQTSWLGGTDAVHEGTWLWSDGLSMTFTAWARGQPDNWRGKQDCMVMNWSGVRLWDDQACEWPSTYVCAMDAAGRYYPDHSLSRNNWD